LALQNYHDTYKVFPMGAMTRESRTVAAGKVVSVQAGVTGPSWWFGILPFCEQRNIYDKVMADKKNDSSAFNYSSLESGQQDAMAKLVPDYMRCPSSPLPVMEFQQGNICLPTYVGIAGGVDITSGTTHQQSQQYGSVTTSRTYVVPYMGKQGDALIASSGMLPPAEHVNIAGCTDGTSNTMIVSEQSDWLRSTTASVSNEYHGDAGWTTGIDGSGGWLAGTGTFDDLRKQVARRGGTSTLDQCSFGVLSNLTTVRYKPDLKKCMGGALGVAETQPNGHNNPLQSAHPGGILCGFVDGSVQFVSGTTDLGVLLRIAIKSDGQNVKFD